MVKIDAFVCASTRKYDLLFLRSVTGGGLRRKRQTFDGRAVRVEEEGVSKLDVGLIVQVFANTMRYCRCYAMQYSFIGAGDDLDSGVRARFGRGDFRWFGRS